MLYPSIEKIEVRDPRTGKVYTWLKGRGWDSEPQISITTILFDPSKIDPYASVNYIVIHVYLNGVMEGDQTTVYCRVSEAGKVIYEETVTRTRIGLLTSRWTGFRVDYIPDSEGVHTFDIYVEVDNNTDSVSISVTAYKIKTFTVVPAGINITDLDANTTWFYNMWTSQWILGTQQVQPPSIPAGHRLRLVAAVDVYTDFPGKTTIYLKDTYGNILCTNTQDTPGYYNAVTCEASTTMPPEGLTLAVEGILTSPEKGTTSNRKSVTIGSTDISKQVTSTATQTVGTATGEQISAEDMQRLVQDTFIYLLKLIAKILGIRI